MSASDPVRARTLAARTLAARTLAARTLAPPRLSALVTPLTLAPLLALGCNALLGLDPPQSLVDGSACSGATDCEAGLCNDGVCCERSCDGPCESCALSGSEGHCQPLAQGLPCRGQTGECDGASAECKSPLGETCNANDDCSTSKCSNELAGPSEPGRCVAADCASYGTECASDLKCCSGICDGKCDASPCAAGQSLDDEGICHLDLGEPCNDDGQGCLSGHCVDGVCCNAPCDGECERCDTGTCTPAALDTDPDGECKAASCGDKEQSGKCRTVVAIGSGGAHSCAVLNDGRLRCWGDGLPVATAGENFKVPGDLTTNAPQLAVGNSHNCVRSDGRVWCWGANDNGQLGVPGGAQALPTEVPLGDNATAIDLAVGWRFETAFLSIKATDYTCAVVALGSGSHELRCWGGMNKDGVEAPAPELGEPTDRVVLSHVGAGQDPAKVSAVAAGAAHACVLFDDAAVWCWTLGSLPTSEAAIHLPGASMPIAIAAGGTRTCALRQNGTVTCWSWNPASNPDPLDFDSQFMDATRVVVSSAPETKFGGDFTACALRTSSCMAGDSCAHCWGSYSSELIKVADDVAASAISLGEEFACALRSPDGNVQCWGKNGLGQLGYKQLPEFIPL